ncbi:MAG: hypothetical protein HY675_25575 [Chloroflexi bacterium]|nr:hypothetical protein [Chloroflexota bacterium]
MATPLPKWLTLDASTLLNLCGTGRLVSIARVLPCRLVVVDYVLKHEVLYIRRRNAEEGEQERELVDLGPLIEQGLIEVVHLQGEEEEATFVDLAAVVDDGEAMSFAVAYHRGWAVATDDRKARRVFAQRAAAVPLITTLQLLRYWADWAGVQQAEVRNALLEMQFAASYLPSEQDPLYPWWREVTQGA